MDPNANLAEQRRLAGAIREAADAGVTEWGTTAIRLAELVEAMDEWMSKGGFLPEAWISTSRLIAPDKG